MSGQASGEKESRGEGRIGERKEKRRRETGRKERRGRLSRGEIKG